MSAAALHGRCALVMAGGTGGHIFPGLAVAEGLRSRGWRVHWLGSRSGSAGPSMESQLVPPRGFPFEAIDFSGVRGKGWASWLGLPLRLLRACTQSLAVLRRVKPDVVIGLGGYVTVPGGLMAVACARPLVLHEQNAVAGSANTVLSRVARRVFTAFPDVLAKSQWVGNPLRTEFLKQPGPAERFAGRSGPLRLLVVGGSLGARVLNELVPQALALLPEEARPIVTHQSGAQQIDAVRRHYAQAGVEASLTPFIDNTAEAFAEADLVICRAGASTVTELAAVGVAAMLVPLPSAIDDHQTANARFLVQQGGGWLLPQRDLTARTLADLLLKLKRDVLVSSALQAKLMQKIGATECIVAACEELAA